MPRTGLASRESRSDGVVGREQQEQLGLQRVRVLELVDEQSGEPALEVFTNVGAVADQIARTQQQVEEVERAMRGLQPFVAVDASLQFLAEQRRQIGVGVGLERVELLQQRLMRGVHIGTRHATRE